MKLKRTLPDGDFARGKNPTTNHFLALVQLNPTRTCFAPGHTPFRPSSAVTDGNPDVVQAITEAEPHAAYREKRASHPPHAIQECLGI